MIAKECTPQAQLWMADEIDRQVRRIPLYDRVYYWQKLGRWIA